MPGANHLYPIPNLYIIFVFVCVICSLGPPLETPKTFPIKVKVDIKANNVVNQLTRVLYLHITLYLMELHTVVP